MSTNFDASSRVISAIYDTALSPASWPEALRQVMQALGTFGAAYILTNKWSGLVEWASFSGPSVELKPDYVRHYAALDPSLPLIHSAPSGSWVRLSEALPNDVLRRDEWYNDFVRKCGVDDILGSPLLEDESHRAIIGIHYGVYQTRRKSAPAALLKQLLPPLSQAARLYVDLRNRGWKSSIASQALNQLADGVIITDGEGHVIELNWAGEQILSRADGLAVRNGKICALRVFENHKLTMLIGAAVSMKTAADRGRMRNVTSPKLWVLTGRKPSCGSAGRGKDAPADRRQLRGQDYNPADTAQLYPEEGGREAAGRPDPDPLDHSSRPRCHDQTLAPAPALHTLLGLERRPGSRRKLHRRVSLSSPIAWRRSCHANARLRFRCHNACIGRPGFRR
jgi:PAS domain-containing protein